MNSSILILWQDMTKLRYLTENELETNLIKLGYPCRYKTELPFLYENGNTW